MVAAAAASSTAAAEGAAALTTAQFVILSECVLLMFMLMLAAAEVMGGCKAACCINSCFALPHGGNGARTCLPACAGTSATTPRLRRRAMRTPTCRQSTGWCCSSWRSPHRRATLSASTFGRRCWQPSNASPSSSSSTSRCAAHRHSASVLSTTVLGRRADACTRQRRMHAASRLPSCTTPTSLHHACVRTRPWLSPRPPTAARAERCARGAAAGRRGRAPRRPAGRV